MKTIIAITIFSLSFTTTAFALDPASLTRQISIACKPTTINTILQASKGKIDLNQIPKGFGAETALTTAAMKAGRYATPQQAQDCRDVTSALLKNGANPNLLVSTKKGFGIATLHKLASKFGTDGGQMALLLNNGANPDIRRTFPPSKIKGPKIVKSSPDQATPLMFLAGYGSSDLKNIAGPTAQKLTNIHLAKIKLLIDKGADINAQNNIGETPLIWAVNNGAPVTIKYLLELGANKEISDTSGKTALDHAIESANEKAIGLLSQ